MYMLLQFDTWHCQWTGDGVCTWGMPKGQLELHLTMKNKAIAFVVIGNHA